MKVTTQYRLAILTGLIVCGFSVRAQPTVLKFEVGTVKISQPGAGIVVPIFPGVRNGSFGARNMELRTLLAYAYDVSEVQISGPNWLNQRHYDIAAKIPEGAQQNDARGMLRELLAERLKVVTHPETREMDVLALVVDGKGHRLRLLKPGESFISDDFDLPKGDSKGLITVNSDMRHWAEVLTRALGSTVIDKTGLVGRYAGAVKYTPYNSVGSGSTEFPSLPIALKEQTGLDLVKRKLMVDMVVVDHVDEIPGEN